MKKFIQSMFLLHCFSISSIFCEAQLSGTKTIPGNYSSIGAALADIQSSGLSGHVILELQQNYNWQNETYPIVVPENFPTAANATVTIRPRIGAVDIHIGTDLSGGVVPPTGDIPIFDIYGSWFNIDGRPAGGGTIGQLFIWSNAQEGTAVQFSNNAGNNKISYCHLKGNNYYANPFGLPAYRKGVLTFNPAGPFPVGVLGGIHDNTIDHNIIEGAIYGGGAIPPTVLSPYYGIYANGNPDAPNINNKILDNEIINFIYSGIEIKQDGPGAGWIIKGNSFYSTLTDYTYPDYAINILHAMYRSGINIIEGNYIGGNARLAAGKWKGGPFFGIVCGTYHGGDSVSVRNNVIKNMEKINPDPYPSSCSNCDRLAAISITNSDGSNKVHCSNNFIGGDAADYGINISAPAAGGNADFYGILYNNCSGGAITQNTIQKISMSSVVKSTFLGIRAFVINNVTISDNLVQDASLQSNGEVFVSGISLIDDDPMLITCEPFSTPPVVENNTVQNINVVQNFDITKFDGLLFRAKNVVANRNRVGSATQSNSISITGGNTVIVNAIHVEGPAQNVSVKNSTLSNITASGLSSAAVNGLYFNGNGTVDLSNNTINNLSSATIRGIYIEPLSGISSATVNNNTIGGAGSGTGIQANVPAGATLNLVANANTVNNWQTGFNIMAAAGSTLTQTVQSNYVTGNQTGYINNSSSTQNATCNWWGSASGPSGAGPGTGDPVGPNVTFSPWATVPTFVAVDAGADQAIYLGYGPTSKTINPVYTVCGTASYLWSTGATTASITVSPTVTTTYSVTVTDANNHSATDNVTVVVKDIRCGTNKVKVCHKENSNKKKTMCISTNDVPDHLAHGDALGDCPAARTFNPMEELNNDVDIEKTFAVYPNPATGYIRLQWLAKANGTTFIKIYDLMGRIVLQQTITTIKGANNRQVLLKGIAGGNYILVMQSAGEVKRQRFTVQH